MKLADWPALDRRLWLAAIAPADPFSETGATRASHRPISNWFVERGYGRWLTFLAESDLLTEIDPPGRITPDSVRSYIADLARLGNLDGTILARLEALSEMAKVFGSRPGWTAIVRAASRVRARSEPSTSKRGRLVSSDELLALGVRLMDGVPPHSSAVRAAAQFRDGLMIGFLALRPLRLRNLAHLTLGRDLLKNDAGWEISLPPSAMKTHVSVEWRWPDELVPPLEKYISDYRPALVSRRGRWHRAIDDRLWVSIDGSPLTEASIYWRIVLQTREGFGRPISPHQFRNAAATTLAIFDPIHVRIGAPLLGHNTFRTTERYYNKAQCLEAHRVYADGISSLRK
jgi:integrase